MDAWQKLISNSSITDGDAWEHLCNQGSSNTVIYHGIEIDIKSVSSSIDLLERYEQINIGYQSTVFNISTNSQQINIIEEALTIE